MIGEVALAIEMGADAVDIGKTIHPHPTLGESIGLAAEAFEGACTDLPPRGSAVSARPPGIRRPR
jgi:dihydrolipoamide dehydrogenase